ncbi:MAG TPA: DUF2959 family protein [Rariglobus sp.]
MKPNIPISALLASLALLAGGCTSNGYNHKAADTSSSLQKAAHDVRQGNGQIDAVLFALSSLVNSPEPDLKPQFNKFVTAVEKLETLSTDISKQTAAMQERGADYFRTWDEELAKIQNEDIRSRSTDRKNTVSARFERVRITYVQTRSAFVPFLSDLKDIRTALSTDLTTGGLASIKSIANQARDNAPPLREALGKLEADFKALGVSLSASTPAQ